MVKPSVNEEIIDKIKEKISKSKGEIILSARELTISEAETHYESETNFYYLETGIISGEMRQEKEPKMNLIKFPDIKLKGVGNFNDTYYYTSDLIVPVNMKLNHESIFFGYNLNVNPENLKKIKNNSEIGFGISEFKNSFSLAAEVMGYVKSVPYLKNLEILVGEEEIKKFIKKSASNYRNLEDFFKLMKRGGEIEERIYKHDYEKRENFIEDLTKNISQLIILNNEIKNVEERVLGAHCSLYREQDGSYLEWNNRESVDKYYEFESQINPLLHTIKDLLNKSKEVGIENHPSIKGNYIGFPAEIKPKQYLDYVQDNIVLTTEKRLEKLRNHLKKEEKKAYG